MDQPNKEEGTNKGPTVGYVMHDPSYVVSRTENTVPTHQGNLSCIGQFSNALSRQKNRSNQQPSKPTTPRIKRKKLSKVRPEYANIQPIICNDVEKALEQKVVLKLNPENLKRSASKIKTLPTRSPGSFNDDRVIRSRSDVYDFAGDIDLDHHRIPRKYFTRCNKKCIIIVFFLMLTIAAVTLIIGFSTDLLNCNMRVVTMNKSGREIESFSFIHPNQSSTKYEVNKQLWLNPNNFVVIKFCGERRFTSLNIDFKATQSHESISAIISGYNGLTDELQLEWYQNNEGLLISNENSMDGYHITLKKMFMNDHDHDHDHVYEKSIEIEKVAIEFEKISDE